MPDMGAGTTLYKYATGVASLSLAPLVPNAAVVRSIHLAAVSASDVWVVRTNGQEVGRFQHLSTNRQNVLTYEPGPTYAGFDIFAYCREVLGIDLIYPIPEGKTLTISSEGGATADIALAYEEFAPSALNPSLVNYPGGGYFICPRWFYVNTHPTVAGEAAIDTEVGLDFTPNLFARGSFPVGWRARVLDLFLFGGGVNTYSGTADHQSNTNYLAAIKNGQRLFTRDALGGLVLVGNASAAGSGNVAIGSVLAAMNDTSQVIPTGQPGLADPIAYKPGDTYDWRLSISGSLTGGANYSTVQQLAIVEYRSS